MTKSDFLSAAVGSTMQERLPEYDPELLTQQINMPADRSLLDAGKS